MKKAFSKSMITIGSTGNVYWFNGLFKGINEMDEDKESAWKQFKEDNAHRLEQLEDKPDTRPEWVNRHDYRFRIIRRGKRSTDDITIEYEAYGSSTGCSNRIHPLLAHVIEDLLNNPSRESDNKEEI